MEGMKKYLIIALVALLVVYAYHHGWLNMVMPGSKTITKDAKAKETDGPPVA